MLVEVEAYSRKEEFSWCLPCLPDTSRPRSSFRCLFANFKKDLLQTCDKRALTAASPTVPILKDTRFPKMCDLRKRGAGGVRREV
jgi:hypothetical protein